MGCNADVLHVSCSTNLAALLLYGSLALHAYLLQVAAVLMGR